MNDAESIELHELCRRYALRHHCRSGDQIDPDDFASWCLIYALKHNGHIGPLLHRFADYHREVMGGRLKLDGTPHSPKSFGKKQERSFYSSNPENFADPDAPKWEDGIIAKIDIEKLFIGLKPHHRLMFYMIYKFGFRAREIAQMRGLTEARISQEINALHKHINRRLKALDSKRLMKKLDVILDRNDQKKAKNNHKIDKKTSKDTKMVQN